MRMLPLVAILLACFSSFSFSQREPVTWDHVLPIGPLTPPPINCDTITAYANEYEQCFSQQMALGPLGLLGPQKLKELKDDGQLKIGSPSDKSVCASTVYTPALGVHESVTCIIFNRACFNNVGDFGKKLIIYHEMVHVTQNRYFPNFLGGPFIAPLMSPPTQADIDRYAKQIGVLRDYIQPKLELEAIYETLRELEEHPNLQPAPIARCFLAKQAVTYFEEEFEKLCEAIADLQADIDIIDAPATDPHRMFQEEVVNWMISCKNIYKDLFANWKTDNPWYEECN